MTDDEYVEKEWVTSIEKLLKTTPSTDYKILIQQMEQVNLTLSEFTPVLYLKIKRAIQTLQKFQPDVEYLTSVYRKRTVKNVYCAIQLFS